MDLNHMLIFKKVAEIGSFSGAAEQLGLVKSSVSQKVSQLEQELGIRLLQRTTRRVSLTEAGERVYEAASRIAAESEEVRAFADTAFEQPSGLLRVTAPHDFGIYLIDHLLINFSARYPKISVELDLSNRFVDLVNEGIDVGVRATSGNLRESSLVVSVLGPTRLRLFASPEWIKKYGLPTSVQALQSLPVIWKIFGNRRHPTSWHLKNIQSEKEINIEVPIKSVIRTNDMLAAKHSAKAGFGIALLPKIACLTEVKRGELINILPEWGQDEGQIYAVYPSRRHLPAKTRAFVEYLKETFQRD